ncbi:MAG: hypothetical protein K6G54_04985 [Oscillospiraceae bacterium]|nr:hypothetical protein [Oscillospiraceae bacterium]
MKRWMALVLSAAMALGLCACGGSGTQSAETAEQTEQTEQTQQTEQVQESAETTHGDHSDIETALNLCNMGQEWTYSEDADAWVLSIVTAVTMPEIVDQQGVSVCVPGAYVKGVDTDGDGTADATEGTVSGALVIDYDASVTSTNGQVYTAATAPVILNTGAAGYGSSTNTTAATTYAKEGYVNVSCGNRGKQDTATDSSGNTYYTGDAPSCLVDQKNAARFVKYNILLGNLPGSVDYWVSTGGSGGGAHAVMFAATGNNPDFYDYEIAAGAVGVYQNDDGSYDTCVNIDGEYVAISDGAWGCMAYSAITSLYEADMALAFEYNLNADYSFGSSFQQAMAKHLAAAYMDYINAQNLTLDGQALTIEYDEAKYPETNGYGGSYLDLYLDEFTENLQWYLDNLDYAEGWTWFGTDGSALSDEAVAAMSTADKAAAFIEGRYAKGSSGGMSGGPGGDMGGGPGGDMGGMDGAGGPPSGEMPSGGAPDAASESSESSERSFANSDVAANSSGDTMDVGTPDAGTTQAAGSSTDSANYASYDEMLAAYQADVAAVAAGDAYGKNIVSLYNPLNYIGAEDTENPCWARILMGASEGDMSMFASLNLAIAFENAGVDAELAWQWDGGHVPSEVLGDSFALWVDTMYGEHVDGAQQIEKAAATAQTENGTADSATGTDLSGWVSYDGSVSFSLADAAAYRTAGASKAIPGFDVIDYGQEDYVFGNSTADARHWSEHVLAVLEENAEELSALFNSGT